MKRKEEVKVIVLHPIDPYGSKIGGTGTFINSFIQFSPPHFTVKFIGVSSDLFCRPANRWHMLKVGTKEFKFFPLFYEKNQNIKKIIPLSLRYSMILRQKIGLLHEGVLFLNRIEPALVLRNGASTIVAVTHTDIESSLLSKNSEAMWRYFPSFYFYCEKLAFDKCDEIFSVSKKTVEFYQQKYKERKKDFTFLTNPVNNEVFYPPEKFKSREPENAPYLPKELFHFKYWILFAGRLQAVKDPFLLFKSFVALPSEFRKKTALILVGDGDLKSDLEAYISKTGFTEQVFFLGVLPQEQLVFLYQFSNLLILTSHFEGMPMCLLEALACGTPAVSTSVGEVKKIIKSGITGEVVENYKPSSISHAMFQVISNPKIYNRENCISIASYFSPEKVLTPLYNSIESLFLQNYRNPDKISRFDKK